MKTTASNLGERVAAAVEFGKYQPVSVPIRPVKAVEEQTRPKSCSTCKGSR